jgi:hypothetical protein
MSSNATEGVSAADQLLGQTDMFGYPRLDPSSVLRRRFGYPPFSVLSARDGEWQERKRQWLALGLQSELGRGQMAGERLTMSETVQRRANATPGGSLMPATDYSRGERGDGRGRAIPGGAGKNSVYLFGSGAQAYEADEGPSQSGTSIFDPVLTELVYRWFCPPGGIILDPFAGGSVRGIVASAMSRYYVGIDLRPEQIAANEQQRAEICSASASAYRPHWMCGDSRIMARLGPLPPVDFVFSCPPYGDLERYSDNPADLSTMSYWEFTCAHSEIIRQAADALDNDRFAAWVVGDYRDRDGCYVGFVADTIGAFRTAGLRLYNEAILVTAVGSLPVRVGKQFDVSRKLGKTHQNLLVFVKGDGRRAAAQCAPTENL